MHPSIIAEVPHFVIHNRSTSSCDDSDGTERGQNVDCSICVRQTKENVDKKESITKQSDFKPRWTTE